MMRKGLIGLVVLGVVFILINRLLGLSERRVETALSYVTYPLLRLQNAVIRFVWLPSGNRKQAVAHVLADLERVTQERDALLNELISLKALERTVRDTQALRDFMKRYKTECTLIAPILLRNFEQEHFFLIDAGEQSGVTKDMIALYQNTIVGKVTQVYPSYSKVLLITDPQCYIAAFCASNGVKGLHHGYKKGFTTLAFVDHREPVVVGDMVLSSGEGGLFPRGFGLGKITQVDQGRYGRTIVITPLFDLKTIDYCCLVPQGITLAEPEAPLVSVPAES